jgi:hypothetical protein
MAEPIRPNPTKTFGKTNWIFVQTIASAAYIPTAAEVNAGTSLDITRIVFASTGKPTQSTNRATAERRLGDTKTYEFIGISNVTGGDMTYAFGAQSAAASVPKQWFEKIPEGTTGFLVERKGLGRATAPATGQFVNAYPVEFGPSFPIDVGQDESAESAMTVTFAVTSDPAINVALT